METKEERIHNAKKALYAANQMMGCTKPKDERMWKSIEDAKRFALDELEELGADRDTSEIGLIKVRVPDKGTSATW